MSSKNPIAAGWFQIAVQALIVIAGSAKPCSSASIAQDVAAHAVFLRRVLAQLVRAQILEAREGRTGGYRLARPAGQITLAEVYAAVCLAGPADDLTPGACPTQPAVLAGVEAALAEVGEEVEKQVLAVLQNYTLAFVLARVAGPQTAIS